MGQILNNLTSIVGILIGMLVVIRMAIWVVSARQRHVMARHEFMLGLREFEQKLEAIELKRHRARQEAPAWVGFRKLQVHSVQRESVNVISINLCPLDDRPLPIFKPGQFVTFQLLIPGQQKPLIRCYSISNRPAQGHYRCTIKVVDATGGVPHGVPASRYLNENISAGDILDVKAPQGKFCLDLDDPRPAILAAGGIGITPIMSMIETAVHEKSNRQLILFYGVRNGAEHVFKDQLGVLQKRHRNLRVITCYSQPDAGERHGVNFDINGRVSIELFREVLPANNYDFYLCGPGSFMQALSSGLREWGVPSNHVHSENFGSVRSRHKPKSDLVVPEKMAEKTKPVAQEEVVFQGSGKTCSWDPTFESLLDFAQSVGVDIDFGCREGNCGTCQTRISSGSVSYNREPSVEVGPGRCLVCIAKPKGPVTLDV